MEPQRISEEDREPLHHRMCNKARTRLHGTRQCLSLEIGSVAAGGHANRAWLVNPWINLLFLLNMSCNDEDCHHEP